ncbi:MAG: M50 family metallopeptidase [Clostridiales bacterium]|nr:M50 family metallopeptidase [Clostridiales bacterium]
MLKITAKLHLHFFTLVLAFLCFFEHRLVVFLLTYATMLVHEMSHLLCARLIGLRTDKICLYPFGVNLKLKNKMVHSFADECILYLSGPLSNALMALLFLMLRDKSYIFEFLYVSNTALAAMNLLPVIPLDGGILLKKIIAHFSNEKTAGKIMKVISASIILCLLGIFVYGVMITEYNFSVLLLCVFLIGNLLVQQEKYDADFVKELMFYDRKNKSKIHHIITDSDNFPDIIHKFHKNKYNIVYQTDKQGHITKTMTEEEILRVLLSNKP